MFKDLSLSTPVGRLRAAAMLEGVSFLILVFIAVPMKHIGHNPLPVRICGSVHGLLFITLCLLLAIAMRAAKLKPSLAAVVFIASLIPFGPFFIDRKLQDVPQS